MSNEILGEALFGTSSGLTHSGTGMLAGKISPNIFEFQEAFVSSAAPIRGTVEPSPFRRLIATPHKYYELLGFLLPARDMQARRGFCGTCVAIRADDLDEVHTGNWLAAFERAKHLLKDLGLFLNADHVLQMTSGAHFETVASGPQTEALELIGNFKEGQLFSVHPDDPMDAISRNLHGVAFCNKVPTLIVHRHSSLGHEYLLSDEITALQERMDAEVARAEVRMREREREVARQKEERRREDAQRSQEHRVREASAALQAERTRFTGASPELDTSIASKSSGRLRDIELELEMLRRDVAELRQMVEAPKSRRRSGQKQISVGDGFDAGIWQPEPRRFPWAVILTGGLISILALFAVLGWIVFGPRGSLDEAQDLGTSPALESSNEVPDEGADIIVTTTPDSSDAQESEPATEDAIDP